MKARSRVVVLAVLMIFTCCFLPSGCQSRSQQAYVRQIQTIEAAYQKGNLTESEYLKLKMDAENAYQQRRATQRAAVTGALLQD
jgi:hypothetical protein